MTQDTQTPEHTLSSQPREKGMAPQAGAEMETNPNLSTEHQREGDARSPSDTLDKGQPGTSEASEATTEATEGRH